ncbi:MAG: sulfite exporter TauE/SafE family protein [Actinomycetota bacterium]|nr:sulfite exporter TauE/SafE family protein [Actinomycetota bacterium]
MKGIVTLGLVGLAAQLIDGTLGMAYGVTSTTLLLTAGYAPAAASASVHLAEIGTTLASGAAHWRFGNVDWHVVRRLALPGAVGAFVGATLLSSISTAAARPWTAGILFALGIYILLRFAGRAPARTRRERPGTRFLTGLGAFAGFVDSTGGGGWGPVATPTLLSTGRMDPRRVIGTVDTSEFLVALGASVGFLLGLGRAGIDLPVVTALLIGGLLAAPVAAWLVRVVPTRLLGSSVGGLILVTNARTLLNALEIGGGARTAVYVALYALWAGALALSVHGLRREPAAGLPADEQRELTGAAS